MNYVVGVTALANFAYILIASMKFFKDADVNTPWLVAFKALSLALFIGYPLGILFADDMPMMRGMLVLILLALSHFTYRWAIATNRQKPLAFCFTENDPGHLQTSGPYKFVRHPFYTSYLLAYAACTIALIHVSYLVVIPFVAMWYIYDVAARSEEGRFAKSPLASEYETYRRETGRFIPKMG